MNLLDNLKKFIFNKLPNRVEEKGNTDNINEEENEDSEALEMYIPADNVCFVNNSSLAYTNENHSKVYNFATQQIEPINGTEIPLMDLLFAENVPEELMPFISNMRATFDIKKTVGFVNYYAFIDQSTRLTNISEEYLANLQYAIEQSQNYLKF